MSEYLLLTGATGLVGQFLTRDLLQSGHRLAVLVRPSKRAAAEERVERIMQNWESVAGTVLPRPVCLQGDVSEPELGLSRADRRWLTRRCDRVIHNAAILAFHGTDRSGEPWRTNVEGTRNVVAFSNQLGVEQFHYVSTAYVCGLREGPIFEDELEMGQTFRNDYEQSKYEAEQLVQAADWLAPPTIYRPAVISGDSRSGYTNTYHGIYVYLRLISMLLQNTEPDEDGRRYTPFRAPLRGDEGRNVVPVDWVTSVICHLVNTPAAHGRTFHLTPETTMTTRLLFDAALRYYNSYGVEFLGPDCNLEQGLSVFEQVYLAESKTYRDYEQSDPRFDTTNLQKFASHLPCPPIDDAMLRRYWKFGEQNRWGKQRQPKLAVSRWAKSLLEEALAGCQDAPPTPTSLTIGLDVHGAGGGQFQICCRADGACQLQRGLPENGALVLQLDMASLQSITAAAKTGDDRVRNGGSEHHLLEFLVDTLSSRSSGVVT